MNGVRKIREKDNDIVKEIKTLIGSRFPPFIGLKVEYFLGEEGGILPQKVLCFNVRSEIVGDVFSKMVRIVPPKPMSEYENEFVGSILGDFIMLGTTMLMNHNELIRKELNNLRQKTGTKPFSEGIVDTRINLN